MTSYSYIINENGSDQTITYYRIIEFLSDCSSPVQIRELINIVDLKIGLSRVNILFQNRIKELMLHTEDQFFIDMYNYTLEQLQDMELLDTDSDLDEYCDLLRESKLDLFNSLTNKRIPLDDIAVILGMSVASIRANLFQFSDEKVIKAYNIKTNNLFDD